MEKLLKGGFSGLVTIIAYYSNSLTPVFYLMLVFAAMDYVTGMAAARWFPAKPEDGWNSKKATQGFLKKITYIFLVGVAWGVDYLILEVEKIIELPLNWGAYFGIFAMCYLILTEAISILENANKMNIDIPFLTSALKMFREKVSSKGGGSNANK